MLKNIFATVGFCFVAYQGARVAGKLIDIAATRKGQQMHKEWVEQQQRAKSAS